MNILSWLVAESGYRWCDMKATSPSSPVLTALRPWPRRELELFPFGAPLFRTFCDLDDTPEAILGFACQFGHLGEFLWLESAYPDLNKAHESEFFNRSLLARVPGGARTAADVRPETLHFWQQQIAAMRETVALWEGVQWGKVDPDEMHRVVEAIQCQSEERIRSRFLRDKTTRKCSWSVQPCDLLGGMWLEFSQAVASNVIHRRCTVCNGWFAVSPKSGRGRKELCSSACKQQSYRLRRARATELCEQGKGAAEIALILETDIETIQGWIRNIAGKLPPLGPGQQHPRGLDL